MAEESLQDKTEQPTEKRRQDSRDKGEVARSRELGTVISILLAAGACYFLGGGILTALQDGMARGLTPDPSVLAQEGGIVVALTEAVTNALVAIAPLLATTVVAALVGPALMGGLVFSGEALVPKPEKLDPIKGLGKIFSSNGLMELLKALAKFLLVATAAYLFFSSVIMDILGLGLEAPGNGMRHAGMLMLWCFALLGVALMLVALVDVPFQIWQHTEKLKMSRQEVRDEMKETEGRPEVKSRIRALQQELAQRRMMEDVKQADVLVRNPTHFAVALKYNESMAAPTVVAKGKDLLALRLIEVAEEHKVAVLSAPPLARALYANAEVGQEIPARLYVAVAQVLAWVYQLRRYEEEAGDLPLAPVDIPVPPDLLDEIK